MVVLPDRDWWYSLEDVSELAVRDGCNNRMLLVFYETEDAVLVWESIKGRNLDS